MKLHLTGTCVALSLALGTVSHTAPGAHHTPLTFDERVEYQLRLERLAHQHRVAQVPDPKPAFEQAMPEAAVRTKVQRYLMLSAALERYWQRPLTGEQLQAEMDRMARDTKQPRVLREMFAALDDDPHVIAECLARPLLAERLVRNWYAHDDRWHGELRRKAEAALAALPAADTTFEQLGGIYAEVTWRRGRGPFEDRVERKRPDAETVWLGSEEWTERTAGIARAVGLAPGQTLRAGVRGSLVESSSDFSVTAVLTAGDDTARIATVRWEKQSFDAWWSEAAADLAVQPPSRTEESTGSGFSTPALLQGDCTDDTWSPTRAQLPERRTGFTTIWTGSEMIVWGGTVDYIPVNSGIRYAPATDDWRPTSIVGAPGPRNDHQAVWAPERQEMIVWGGASGLNTGGRYSPAGDTWRPTSTINAPQGRTGHRAVWTGTEMVLWGGRSGSSYLDTGGRYSPSADSWTTTQTIGAPSPRSGHTAVWSPEYREMIVWGGYQGSYLDSGGRYSPSSNSWSPTRWSEGTTPSPRGLHTAVWTGAEMIVWGGYDGSSLRPSAYFNNGARYVRATDTWASLGATTLAPRGAHTAVWTGSEMLVWGGHNDELQSCPTTPLGDGARYSPTANSWTPMNSAGAPSDRSGHTAVWTGTEMIVWGGRADIAFLVEQTWYQCFDVEIYNSGGRYSPATNSWIPTNTGAFVPPGRMGTSAVWTGAELVIWGGFEGDPYRYLHTGAKYVPSLDTWNPIRDAYYNDRRAYHTAVWTGSEMIVWGGHTGDDERGPRDLNTGLRYSPAQDTWNSMFDPGGPSFPPYPNMYHTAVWTGTAMIVWGGFTNAGWSYDPVGDRWYEVTTFGAPEARSGHSAVWTGDEMVVWGGSNGSSELNTGGHYSPTTQDWTPTETEGAPDPRSGHTAVWSPGQRKMIVWGGWGGSGGGRLNTGGVYSSDWRSWTPTRVDANTPGPRTSHTAVWSGTEMIVWGGASPYISLASGGRYSLATDSWSPTSIDPDTPSPRYGHVAVWADSESEMIVWGGQEKITGGRYCALPCIEREWFKDADFDGWGSASISQFACDPPGLDWTSTPGDCNDVDASVYPAAPQLCDGKNNNCSDPGYPTVPPNEVDNDGDGTAECRGDCNDADASIYAGAAQLCDGKNNNCSDPGYPTVPLIERDADSDNFRICAGDCDDTRAQVNPGRLEDLSAPGTCSDGLDNDCDGKTDAAEAGCLVPLYELAAVVDYYRRPGQAGGEQWAEGITVELMTAPSQAFVGRASTQTNGEARFTGLASGSYVLKPHRTELLPAPAVTPADAALIVSAWLGTVAPLSAIQRKAADVDLDGQPGISDASRIMRHWLGRVGRFPAAAALSPQSDLGFEPPSDTSFVPSDGPSRFTAYCFGDVNSDWWTHPAQGGAIAGTTVRLGPALSADETDGGGETVVLLEGAEIPRRDESQAELRWVDAGAGLYRVAGPARALRSISITGPSPAGDERDTEAAARRVVWSARTLDDRPTVGRSGRQRIRFRSEQPTYSLALVLRLAPGSRDPRPVLEPPFPDWVVLSHYDAARRELRIAAFGVANPLPAGRHALSLTLDDEVASVQELRADEGNVAGVRLVRDMRPSEVSRPGPRSRLPAEDTLAPRAASP